MEFEVESKLFKNATVRKEYIILVTQSFEAAQGHAELICLYQDFEPTFDKMKASGSEYDHMAHDIIHARYRAFHTRIDEQMEQFSRLLGEEQERKERYE